MADETVILELRRLINEMTDQDPWTDLVLSVRIDEWTGTLDALAAKIWREKAATYAELIDIKEGNSDRKMSQLYSQALKMADGLDGGIAVIDTIRRPARTRPIERM